MLVKKLVLLLAALAAVAQATLAAPILSVANGGLSAGNQVWSILVAADPTLFGVSPPPTGGSVAMEVGFEFEGVVLTATRNAGQWIANPGNNPFTGTVTNGVTLHPNFLGARDGVFAALGSDFLFTNSTPVQALTIVTQGVGGTLFWGGQTVTPSGGAPAFVGGVLAQEGMLFNGIRGSFTISTVPEPATSAMLGLAIVGLVGWVRLRA